MGRPNNQAGCTKFGKLINGQGAIRAGRVSNFSEINKRACPFIRQVRVLLSENTDFNGINMEQFEQKKSDHFDFQDC